MLARDTKNTNDTLLPSGRELTGQLEDKIHTYD